VLGKICLYFRFYKTALNAIAFTHLATSPWLNF
jgi:hypothetical protein